MNSTGKHVSTGTYYLNITVNGNSQT